MDKSNLKIALWVGGKYWKFCIFPLKVCKWHWKISKIRDELCSSRLVKVEGKFSEGFDHFIVRTFRNLTFTSFMYICILPFQSVLVLVTDLIPEVLIFEECRTVIEESIGLHRYNGTFSTYKWSLCFLKNIVLYKVGLYSYTSWKK